MELVKDLVFKNDTTGLKQLLRDQEENEFYEIIFDEGLNFILNLSDYNMSDFLFKILQETVIEYDGEEFVLDFVLKSIQEENFSSIKNLVRTVYKNAPWILQFFIQTLMEHQYSDSVVAEFSVKRLIFFYNIYFEDINYKIKYKNFNKDFLEIYNSYTKYGDKDGLTNQNTYMEAIFDILSKKSVEDQNEFFIEITKFNMKNTFVLIKARPAFREITNNYKEYLYEPEGPIGKKIITCLNLQKL